MSVLRRRNMVFGLLAIVGVVAAGGLSTNGFGLFPKALAAVPVFSDGGLAIRGYDPVAYFTEGKPVEGKAEFTAEWNGATWRFASAANRDTFLADPAAYAPQYGGHCAWGLAEKGQLFSTQPRNWTIVDGKLYLNYNDSVQSRWEKDIPGFIAEGDRRWPEVVGAQ